MVKFKLLEKEINNHKMNEKKLKEQIEELQIKINKNDELLIQQNYVINTLLEDKNKDSEKIKSETTQKYILGILTLILPIITNLTQFFISRYLK